MRFGLRKLFLLITIAAILLGGWAFLRNDYYAQIYDLNEVLAQHPEIEKVWIRHNPDIQIEVDAVYFSIAGQPNVTFYARGLDGSNKQDFQERLERALVEQRPVDRPSDVEEHSW